MKAAYVSFYCARRNGAHGDYTRVPANNRRARQKINLEYTSLRIMKHATLTSQVISLCIKVHKSFGPGLLESVYEEALCYELAQAGIPFKRQKGIPVTYGEIKLDMGFRADLIIADKVLLELKSVEAISPVHAKILLTYLKLSGIELGLLINFNVPMLKNGITRVIYDRESIGFKSNEVA